MWELDYKESWAPKNWCFWTVLEKTLESPWNSKEIKPVNPKGKQPWIFIGRTDAKAEAPILWPPDAKNGLTGENPDAGKDWGREAKRMTEDEMVVWHHQLYGHEFEQAPGVGEGQGRLVCCSPRSRKESDMTEWLNWTELNWLCFSKVRVKIETNPILKGKLRLPCYLDSCLIFSSRWYTLPLPSYIYHLVALSLFLLLVD